MTASTSVERSATITRSDTSRAATGYVAAALFGVALTVAGELTSPFDLPNALSVAVPGLVAVAVLLAVVVATLLVPRAIRGVLVACAVASVASVSLYFLPIAWVVGAAGVAVAWGARSFAAGPDRDTRRVERVCALVCGFVAVGWGVAYLTVVVAELL